MNQGGPENNAMGKNDPTNAGYDQPLPSYDQTNAGYNQPGQHQPPQPGYYQPQQAPSGQPQPVVYGQPQPEVYGQPQPGSSYVMPMTAGTNTIIVQNAVIVPPSYMVLACLVCWFCNPLIGGIAIILSFVSMNAAGSGDMQQARCMGRASMWTSIAGVIMVIVAGIICVIIIATSGGSVYNEDCYDIYDC